MSWRHWAPGKEMEETPSYALARASATSLPTAVTARTRPPAVTSRPSESRAVPEWRTCTSDSLSRVSVPTMTSPFEADSGYPAEAITTATAAPGFHTGGGTEASVPVAAPTSSGESGESSRASSGWVSGSPKRALNSTTRRPRDVSARPAYSRPWNGVPRRAISSIVGWMTSRWISATRSAAAHGSGV